MRRCWRIVAILAVLPVTTAAADAEQPEPSSLSYYYDALDQSVTRPLWRSLDPSLLVRKLTGNRREAANVDENDQVRLPSTWWQPRVGYRPVSPAQMIVGPGPGTGPTPPPWTVVSAKTQGVTPGFQIKDATGQRFLLKFDPKEWPEMATGADVATTYLYWAAGYNTPDNAIVFFRPDDLVFDASSTYEDASGNERPITQAFMDDILGRVHRREDGTYRASSSRFIKGRPLGEWLYEGRRKDDPEDLVPHQHRREIRGLYAINAWTNHADASARNTLDMWVTEGGRSFVRHYLIDFGAALGSASIAPHSARTGHEYLLDYGAAAVSLVTLGLMKHDWESAQSPDYPAVGFFESKTFHPKRWRPYLPNPALDQRTERDIRWGANIVAGFTDELIRTAIERARYSDPRVTEYMVQTLIERRDKIVARWVTAEAQP